MKNQIGVYEASEYDLNSAGWGRMALVHGQNAGAMYLEVETLTVFECYFFNNSNLKGGAVYLNKNKKYDNQYVSIQNTIFSNNEAGDNGAAIEFENDILFITGEVTNCYFFQGFAWRNR
jgi:predicted outer membrane repeat protein